MINFGEVGIAKWGCVMEWSKGGKEGRKGGRKSKGGRGKKKVEEKEGGKWEEGKEKGGGVCCD